jgi:mannitol/fructose-specific phosphotransferase system IIA component (Ntr-type)
MNLADIIGVEQIVPQLAAADRWQVIDRLVDVLVATGKVRERDSAAVRKAVREREQTKTTGIGYGIALPHASVTGIADVVAVLARLQPPVDFQSPDGRPVSLCVLFLTPQGQFQSHLFTLSALARFLADQEQRRKLETAATAQEIHVLFHAAAG